MRICLFIHFSITDEIPYYVRIYINELSTQFDEVRFLCNNKRLKNHTDALNENVSFFHDKNQGYDFGRIYQHLNQLNLDKYSQIACVNDSNVLIGKLNPVMNWGNSSDVDFWGLLDSYEKPWFSEHENNHHIQSHFIVFNRKALKKLPEFFDSLDLKTIFEEEDVVKLRRKVINDWEIGLTQFFSRQGLNCKSYFDSRKYYPTRGKRKHINVAHKKYDALIKDGYPLIKRKVILKEKWFDQYRFKNHWKKTIKKNTNYNHAIKNLRMDLI